MPKSKAGAAKAATKSHAKRPAAAGPRAAKKVKPEVAAAVEPVAESMAVAESAVGATAEEMSTPGEDSPCNEIEAQVGSIAASEMATPPSTNINQVSDDHQEKQMTIQLVTPKERKDGRSVIFNIEGRTGSIQFQKTLFKDGALPTSLTLSGEFAEAKPKAAPRVAMTAEERKAARAAKPKLSAAEKLARAEARVAALRSKVAGAPAEATQTM